VGDAHVERLGSRDEALELVGGKSAGGLEGFWAFQVFPGSANEPCPKQNVQRTMHDTGGALTGDGERLGGRGGRAGKMRPFMLMDLVSLAHWA
jgi:hypothetical protein